MLDWFNKQSKLVKVLLLIFPFINWIVEIILRVDALLKKSSGINVVGLILSVFFGVIMGWIDCVLVAIDNKGYLLIEE